MNFIVQHGTVGASFDLSQWGVGARTALLKISAYCMTEECTVDSFFFTAITVHTTSKAVVSLQRKV